MDGAINVIAIALLCMSSVKLAVASEEMTANKGSITEDEFMLCFRQGVPIINRRIPALFVAEAIFRSQETTTDLDVSRALVLKNCTVFGRLERRDLPKEAPPSEKVGFTIECIDTDFSDEVDLRSTEFERKLKLTNCHFRKTALFDGSVFNGFVFDSCQFTERAAFIGCAFGEDDSPDELETSTFSSCNFHGPAVFDRASFDGDFWFEDLIFQRQAFFREAALHGAYFYGCSFEGPVYFDRATFERVSYVETVFNEDSFFDRMNSGQSGSIPQGDLFFQEVRFKGRVKFSGLRVDSLDFSYFFRKHKGPSEKSTARSYSATIFEKRASFARLVCRQADFNSVEFLGTSDFDGARFLESVDFTDAIFENDVTFFGAGFPRPPQDEGKILKGGLILDRSKFGKSLGLTWSEIGLRHNRGSSQTRLNTGDPRTWETLKRAFHQNSDLKSENEALYNEELLKMRIGSKWLAKLSARASWLFWGYGVRPIRLAGWIVIVYSVFTLIYWTQTRGMASAMARVRFAAYFSLRNSLTIFYGFERTLTPLFKGIALFQAVVAKIMFILLLQAISNVSPLLKELFGKFIPT